MSSVIGSGAHNIPLKYIGGGSEEFTSSNQYIGARPMLSYGTEETPADKSQSSLLEYSLGNRSITLANGNRELVNDGSKLGTFPLATGQGLAFDGTQGIATGHTPDISLYSYTIIWVQVKSAANNTQLNGSSNAGLSRFFFGHAADGVRVGIGTGAETLPVVLPAGDAVTGVAVYNSVTKLVTISVLGTGHSLSYTTSIDVATFLPLNVGNLNLGGSYLFPIDTAQVDVIVIPQALTTQELEMHRQRPELTLYKKADGILRSAFLPQTTLDLMEAGIGFHYPLSEGAGAVAHNHALRTLEPKTIVNAANSAIWDNAKDLPYGVQQVLVKPDSLGLNTMLADKDVLEFNGKNVITANLTLENGDWFFDFYAKANPSGHGNNWPVFARLDAVDAIGAVVGGIEIWYSVGDASIDFGGNDVSATTNSTEGIYTIEWVDNILTIYHSGVLIGTSLSLPAYDHFIITYLGQGSNAAATINGSLYVQSGKVKRTEEERLDASGKLKNAFNVVASNIIQGTTLISGDYTLLTDEGFTLLTNEGYTLVTD